MASDGLSTPAAAGRLAAVTPESALGCIPFEQLEQTEQWHKAQEWLDGLGSGILFDIDFNTRKTKLASYLDISPAQLAERIKQGDAGAKLVKAELNYHQIRDVAFSRDVSADADAQALQLLQEARKLWWEAVIEGGYTTALVNLGQSYAIEERILERHGQLSYAKKLELEKLSYRYGEAPEVLITGLGDKFYEFGDMLAPVDELNAALHQTVLEVETERAKRKLPSLRTNIPPEREWVMQQQICHD